MIRALFSLILVFVIACSSRETEENATPAIITTPNSLNPNGDSELAILMRKMADWTEKTALLLASGDSLPAYPADFVQIHTAQRSDSSFDKNTIRLMGSSYLSSLEVLYKASPGNRKEAFNATVNGCLSCHNTMCPGPIKRIGKMLLP